METRIVSQLFKMTPASEKDVEGDALNGATHLACALKTQGVEYMFEVVRIPVVVVAQAAQAEGIKYTGIRNEQAVSVSLSSRVRATVKSWIDFCKNFATQFMYRSLGKISVQLHTFIMHAAISYLFVTNR